MNFQDEYENKNIKSISSYTKDNLAYSEEPYEFRIDGGTPNGKIIIPNKPIHLPYDTKKVSIDERSVNVRSSKIISIDEIEKDSNQYIEIGINHKVSFNFRLYDRNNEAYKIICLLSKYPTPNEKINIKDFIRAYSSVNTKVLVECNNNSNKINFAKMIVVNNSVIIKDIYIRFCKQQEFIGCYDINYEDYADLLIGMEICNKVEIW